MPSTSAVARALLLVGTVPVAVARAQDTTATRAPTAVAAPLEVTWAAVERLVRSEPSASRLDLLQSAPSVRRGRWLLTIPTSDFRAAEWAICQSGAQSAVAPRQGRIEVEVRGDTAASTIRLSAQWSAFDPDAEQRAIECRDLGRYQREGERAVKQRAEREARRR
jgi:hypothetical protein